jgi:hypothetical protein
MARSQTQNLGLDWSAVIWSGLIAGLVFLIAEMGLVTLMGESPWGPPRMMAAIVLGEGVLPPPATFDMAIVMVAMVLHFALSLVLAAIFGLFAGSLDLPKALAAGAVFGLVVYAVNFYGFTYFFPWFSMARNAVTIASHAIFGLVLAWTYMRFQASR